LLHLWQTSYYHLFTTQYDRRCSQCLPAHPGSERVNEGIPMRDVIRILTAKHAINSRKYSRHSSRRFPERPKPDVTKASITSAGSCVSFSLSSRSTAISGCHSDIDARNCVFMRCIAEKLRSAVADATGSVKAVNRKPSADITSCLFVGRRTA